MHCCSIRNTLLSSAFHYTVWIQSKGLLRMCMSNGAGFEFLVVSVTDLHRNMLTRAKVYPGCVGGR